MSDCLRNNVCVFNFRVEWCFNNDLFFSWCCIFLLIWPLYIVKMFTTLGEYCRNSTSQWRCWHNNYVCSYWIFNSQDGTSIGSVAIQFLTTYLYCFGQFNPRTCEVYIFIWIDKHDKIKNFIWVLLKEHIFANGWVH